MNTMNILIHLRNYGMQLRSTVMSDSQLTPMKGLLQDVLNMGEDLLLNLVTTKFYIQTLFI